MLRDINEVYTELVRKRIGDISDNIIIENEEFCKCQNKLSYLFDEIKKNLSQDHSHLLYALEEVINTQSVIAEEIIYKQAVRDFLELKALVS